MFPKFECKPMSLEPKILGVLCCLPDVFQKPAAEASLYPRQIHYPNYQVQEVSKTKQNCQSNIYRVDIIRLCLK